VSAAAAILIVIYVHSAVMSWAFCPVGILQSSMMTYMSYYSVHARFHRFFSISPAVSHVKIKKTMQVAAYTAIFDLLIVY